MNRRLPNRRDSFLGHGATVATLRSQERQPDTYVIDGYEASVSRIANGYKAVIDLGAPLFCVAEYAGDVQTAIEKAAETCNRLKVRAA
jgi:hypothetical protein